MGKVISVSTTKGGVGKTTSTIELAATFKKMGYKVLVIDLDENQSLSKNVGADVETNNTIFEVLKCEIPYTAAIQELECFDIIPASRSLSTLSELYIGENNEDEDDDDEMKSVIFDLKKLLNLIFQYTDYQYIFLDTQPSKSTLLQMVYLSSDYICIPTVVDDSSVEMVMDAETEIKKLVVNPKMFCNAKVLGYILTDYSKTNLHNIAIEKLKIIAKYQEGARFISKVSHTIKASEAKTLKTSISTVSPGSKYAREYYEIAENMLNAIKEYEE